MIQPNVYWTLDTPLATFIGLYTNVPEGGWMDDTQIAWLENEPKTAPTDKALILAMHHSTQGTSSMALGSLLGKCSITPFK